MRASENKSEQSNISMNVTDKVDFREHVNKKK